MGTPLKVDLSPVLVLLALVPPINPPAAFKIPELTWSPTDLSALTQPATGLDAIPADLAGYCHVAVTGYVG